MRRSGLPLAVFCLLFTASFSFAQKSSAQPQITQPLDEQTLTSLSGNTHPLARGQFDQGPAPLGLPMERMLLVLKRSPVQETALRTLVDNQQDKSSPSYHKWLTPDEFGQQFGPADADVQTVTTWLELHGFQVAQVSHSKGVIEFSGTAGQVQQTFHTSIHKYTVNGEDHWANASDPQIPSALAPVVAGVLSLHNFQKKSSGQFAGNLFEVSYHGASYSHQSPSRHLHFDHHGHERKHHPLHHFHPERPVTSKAHPQRCAFSSYTIDRITI